MTVTVNRRLRLGMWPRSLDSTLRDAHWHSNGHPIGIPHRLESSQPGAGSRGRAGGQIPGLLFSPPTTQAPRIHARGTNPSLPEAGQAFARELRSLPVPARLDRLFPATTCADVPKPGKKVAIPGPRRGVRGGGPLRPGAGGRVPHWPPSGERGTGRRAAGGARGGAGRGLQPSERQRAERAALHPPGASRCTERARRRTRTEARAS